MIFSKINLFCTYILLVLVVCGCGKKKLEFKGLAYFPKDFTSHFPNEVPYSFSQHVVSQNLSNSHPYVWLKYNLGRNEMDSILTKLKDDAIAIYQSDDPCLLVIDKHLNKENWRNFDKTVRKPKVVAYNEKSCQQKKLPVPNFYEESWEEDEGNLTGIVGYEMFVLSAKSGVFMDSTKLPNGLYTPEGWKHGVSKGVAVNRGSETIIFWADIW